MGRETLAWEIAETAHMVRRAYDRSSATLGVTRSQWRVLLRLSHQPDLRQVELADILDVEPITLCRIVDRLEDAGLVERRRDPADRRAWRLALTDQSGPLLESLKDMATELGDEAFAGLDPSQVATLRSLLEHIRVNLSGAAQPTKVSA